MHSARVISVAMIMVCACLAAGCRSKSVQTSSSADSLSLDAAVDRQSLADSIVGSVPKLGLRTLVRQWVEKYGVTDSTRAVLKDLWNPDHMQKMTFDEYGFSFSYPQSYVMSGNRDEIHLYDEKREEVLELNILKVAEALKATRQVDSAGVSPDDTFKRFATGWADRLGGPAATMEDIYDYDRIDSVKDTSTVQGLRMITIFKSQVIYEYVADQQRETDVIEFGPFYFIDVGRNAGQYGLMVIPAYYRSPNYFQDASVALFLDNIRPVP